MQRAHTRRGVFRPSLARLAAIATRGALCLLLAGQLLLIAIISIRGELPVPQFLLESLHRQLARSDYTVTWKDVHINLTGQILVQGLEVGVGSGGEHNRLLTADGALVRFSMLRLLTGRFSPRSLVIENASLFSPALLSPTGELATVLDAFSLNLRRTHTDWKIRVFRANVLGVRVLAEGDIPRSWFKSFAAEAFSQPDQIKNQRTFLQRYGDVTQAILEQQPQLADLDSPSIFLHFAPFDSSHSPANNAKETAHGQLPTAGRQLQPTASRPEPEQTPPATVDDSARHLLVKVSLAARGYRNEALSIEAGEGFLRSMLVFDSHTLPYVLGTPYASLEQFKWADNAEAERIFLLLPRPAPTSRSLQAILSTPLDSVRISGWRINLRGLPLEQARLRLLSADGSDLLKAKHYLVHASIASGWNYLGAFARLNRTERNGWVDFIADWNTGYLQQIPPQKLPEALLKQAQSGLDAPLHGAGHLLLGTGFHPQWAAAHLRVGHFSYDTMLVDYAYARAHWSKAAFAVEDAVVYSPEGYQANVAYWQDLHTHQYRVQAKGTINPRALNPIIDDAWWRELWGDFEFTPQLWPSASFAMVGTHNMGTVGKQIFVQAQIQDAFYREIPVRLANAEVFMDGDRVDLYNFDLETHNGHASVHVQWQWEENSSKREYLAFTATGTLPIAEATMFVGPATAEATADIRSQLPPRASLVGVLMGDQSHSIGEEIYLKLLVDFPASLSTPWVNFDKVKSHMLMTPTTRVFPDIEATLATGQLSASVGIELLPEDRLFFKTDFDLKNGNIDQLEKALPLLKQSEEQMLEQFPDTMEPGQQIALASPMGEHGVANLPQAAEVTTAVTEQVTIASDTQSLLDKPGQVDFKGSINGVAQQMDSINGAGTLLLRNTNLGEIHLLGPVSRLLQFIGLPLATLAFDKAETPWSIKDGVIYFPDLNVSGNTGLLTASGNIDLTTNNLNFLVYLHPLGEFSFPVLSQALYLLSPLSNVISVRINGSLDDPQVQTNIRPGGIFRGREMIDPHDMATPDAPEDTALPPRKLRRPSVSGPR